MKNSYRTDGYLRVFCTNRGGLGIVTRSQFTETAQFSMCLMLVRNIISICRHFSLQTHHCIGSWSITNRAREILDFLQYSSQKNLIDSVNSLITRARTCKTKNYPQLALAKRSLVSSTCSGSRRTLLCCEVYHFGLMALGGTWREFYTSRLKLFQITLQYNAKKLTNELIQHMPYPLILLNMFCYLSRLERTETI